MTPEERARALWVDAWGEDAEAKYTQPMVTATVLAGLAGAIRAAEHDALEQVAKWADERAEQVAENVKDDKATLGNMYDMNNYGAGFDEGQKSVATKFAHMARALKEQP